MTKPDYWVRHVANTVRFFDAMKGAVESSSVGRMGGGSEEQSGGSFSVCCFEVSDGLVGVVQKAARTAFLGAFL